MGRIEKWDTLFVHETLCDITWQLGYLYVKVNISAWQFNKSGQGACQCGFIVCAVKEVLWYRVAVWCRASAHKFNPHKAQASWSEKVFVRLLLFCALPAVGRGKLLTTDCHRKRDFTSTKLSNRGPSEKGYSKTLWKDEDVVSCFSVWGKHQTTHFTNILNKTASECNLYLL